MTIQIDKGYQDIALKPRLKTENAQIQTRPLCVQILNANHITDLYSDGPTNQVFKLRNLFTLQILDVSNIRMPVAAYFWSTWMMSCVHLNK